MAEEVIDAYLYDPSGEEYHALVAEEDEFSNAPFQAVRHKPDDRQHGGAEKEHVVIGKPGCEYFFEKRENGRPHDRRIEVSHAAEYRHQNRHERELDIEG